MMDKEVLLQAAERFSTPSYIFDTDEFRRRIRSIGEMLGQDIPLCYSIKANPFLLAGLSPEIDKLEVCSPGELSVCERLNIDPKRIIYSGVNKGIDDVRRAVSDQVAILTAESLLHADLIDRAAREYDCRVKVLLRISSGNQFGMSVSDAARLLDDRSKYPAAEIIGLHYYSGTQKKRAEDVQKDISRFTSAIEQLTEQHDFRPQLIEYGPGLGVEYFKEPYEEKDMALLREVSGALREFAGRWPVSLEMGRFAAAGCGTYLTAVADVKMTDDNLFAICDGGINHLKYYGQTMAMQAPPISAIKVRASGSDRDYTLCGSLCTTADVLVRKVSLPPLDPGDVLAFHRCGAYSVTEGIGLFLSRTLPRIILWSEKQGLRLVRDFYETDLLNTPAGAEE